MENGMILEQIKQVAQVHLPKGSQLLLFGSRARGTEQADSDWDLLILLDKSELTLSDYGFAYPFRELGWNLGEDIAPQVYSKEEWNHSRFTPFYKNVEHDKIILL